MNPVAKYLIAAGVALIVVGFFWQFGNRIFGGLPIGKLPGDIAIERENFRFYFPVVTSLLVSVVVSLILVLIRFFSR